MRRRVFNVSATYEVNSTYFMHQFNYNLTQECYNTRKYYPPLIFFFIALEKTGLLLITIIFLF